MKQTAVEILEQELEKLGVHLYDEVQEAIDQAKEMEKEQIIEAYDYHRCIGDYQSGKEYYNETFKSE